MQGTNWFSVHVVAARDAAVVVLAGEMDLASVASFDAVFEATLRSGPQRVVIDLDAVAFIDAAGLGALVRARRLGQSAGLRVSFHRPSVACHRVLGVAETELLIDPAESRGARPMARVLRREIVASPSSNTHAPRGC